MKKIHYAMIAIALLLAGGILSSYTHPSRLLATDYVRVPSYAIPAAQDTALKRVIALMSDGHNGQSGFKILTRGEDSLLARISMIQAAQRSLDIQYYMIEDDVTGKLLLEAILRAADRGVRVRILMDDLNMHGLDSTWSLLNAHRNIDIRIFNPFVTRDEPLFTRAKGLFTGLDRFTRRMHNKILVADNQIAVTGGRNLGDSYFDASSDFNFHDVDILVVGPLVSDMSQSFDKYWNGDEAFPIAVLLRPRDDLNAVNRLREELQKHWQDELQKGVIASQLPLTAQLSTGKIGLLWAHAQLAVDSPAKIDLPKTLATSKPAFQLDQMAEHAQHEFIIVSPYFVPGEQGTKGLKDLVQRGVHVRVLTNSLASIDNAAAYTGFRHYRDALVKDGVDVYEMQPAPGPHPHSHHFSSSARNSLHSKIYVVDRSDVIVGSYNLDPRSTNLNTEIALVIHSPELAAQLLNMFDKATAPSACFHLVMEDNRLEWVTQEDGQEKRYTSEPKAGFWRKLKADMLGFLPIEEQL